jgi:hypothetical protein
MAADSPRRPLRARPSSSPAGARGSVGVDANEAVVTQRLRSVLRGSKDAALAFGARAYVNTRLRGIGEMTELSIDTKNRTLRVRLDLVGESAPVEIHIKKYDLEQTETATRVRIVDAIASREWLTGVLREFVVGRSFTLPARAGDVLKLLT